MHFTRNDLSSAAECLHELAVIDQQLAHFPESREKLEAAVKEFQAIGSHGLAAQSMEVLAQVTLSCGDNAKASLLLDEVLVYFQSQGDVRAVANVTRSLGSVEMIRQNFTKARDHFISAKAAFFELEGWSSYAKCLILLAQMESRLGNWDKVEGILEEARKSCLKENNTLQAARCLVEVASNLQRQGRNSASMDPLMQALAEFRLLGAKKDEITCLQDLASVHWMSGRDEEAAVLSKDARIASADLGYPVGEAHAMLLLGNLASKQENYPEAKRCFTEARAKYEESGLTASALACTQSLGLLHYQWPGGDASEGERLLVEAKAGMLEAGLLSGAATLCLIWGPKFLGTDIPRARELSREAMSLFEDLGDLDGVARGKNQLGLSFMVEDVAEARRLLTEAKADFVSLSLGNEAALCTRQLGSMEYTANNYRESLQQYRDAEQMFRDIGNEAEAQVCAETAKVLEVFIE